MIVDVTATPAKMKIEKREKSEGVKPKPNWDKIDIIAYKEATKRRLDIFIDSGGLQLPPDIIVSRLTSIMNNSADENRTKKSTMKKRKSKRPWSSDMKALVKDLKRKAWLWKQDGNDVNSPHKKEVRDAKKELRSIQRQLAANERKTCQSEIMRAHEGEKDLFYRLVKKQRGNTGNWG